MDCVIYCRVSSEGQLLGDGLRRQMVNGFKYAGAHRLNVLAVFSEARSGLDDLPVRRVAELMAAKHGCKILCEAPDRWSRQGAKDVAPNNVEFTSKTSQQLPEILDECGLGFLA